MCHVRHIGSTVYAVGVACGSDLLIYKNNKPYFKYSIAPLPPTALELDVWQRISTGYCGDAQHLIEELKNVPFHTLTPRSQQLIMLPSTEVKEFAEKFNGTEPRKNSPITCMTTINRNAQDAQAVSCPVIATECGQIYILEPQTLSVLHQASISNVEATPFIIKASGMLDIEYRIIVACREGYVCLLRRGWLEGKNLFQATTLIIDMVLIPGDNFITFATTDKTLQSYTKKGNKLWSLKMNHPVTCLSLIFLKHLNTSLVAVGMRGGAIHLYQGRHAVDFISAPDTPSAIEFGQLGQEEHVMVIITLVGTINFKILKRTADFNLPNQDSNNAPVTQTKPLPLPKRSKLFLEQNMRERQHALDMHQKFQEDLIRLRLTASRAMVQIQCDQSGTGNEKEQVKLSAQVLGLGPKFTLILTLENMSTEAALVGLSAVFHCKQTIYKLSNYVINIPLIPPGLAYKIETKVTECAVESSPTNQTVKISTTQVIRVFVTRKGQVQPVLAATINMPPSDPLAYTI